MARKPTYVFLEIDPEDSTIVGFTLGGKSSQGATYSILQLMSPMIVNIAGRYIGPKDLAPQSSSKITVYLNLESLGDKINTKVYYVQLNTVDVNGVVSPIDTLTIYPYGVLASDPPDRPESVSLLHVWNDNLQQWDKMAPIVVTTTGGGGGGGSSSGMANTIAQTANSDIDGYCLVQVVGNNTVDYADSNDLTCADRVIGINTLPVAQLSVATVQILGVMSNSNWDWDIEFPIFLGEGGQLTQSVATTGFVLQVATPISGHDILIGIKQPIVLA